MNTARSNTPTMVAGRMSTLDKYLAVWIGVAMVAGLALGRLAPRIADALDTVTIGSVSLPIAIGLLVMMYPVLAKVRYDEVGHVARDTRTMVLSLVLNWLIGPAVMFALAWIFLADLPELPQTRAMLMRACDTRLPARLTRPELDFIASAIVAAALAVKG